MIQPETIGVILAGGLARRMGGGDKPLLEIAGRSMLARAVSKLRGQCTALILNANGDPRRFDAVGLPVVADGIADYPGPLAGILAGMDWAAEHRPDVEWVVSAAADQPFLPADFVARLHRARREAGADLALAASGGRTHPVNGLWRVSLREDLRHALEHEGLRKIDLWTGRHAGAVAEWQREPVDPFFNANRPEDVEEAERLAAELGL